MHDQNLALANMTAYPLDGVGLSPKGGGVAKPARPPLNPPLVSVFPS